MGQVIDLKREKAFFIMRELRVILENENYNEKLGEEIKSHIKNIPMLIHTNGLIAAITFINIKSKKEKEKDSSYDLIQNIISAYIKKYNKNIYDEKFETIIKNLIECDHKKYRQITIDFFLMLEWLVRLSESML